MRLITILLLSAAMSAKAQTSGAAMEDSITGTAGRFRAPLLAPVEYDLSISAEDFVRAGAAMREST